MPLSAYDLTGRAAFITGAASGIGRASALLLAEAGATAHCVDRDETGLRRTYDLIADAGGSARIHRLDVTDRGQVRAAVGAAGHLDILVASAGVMHSSSVLETADEDLERVLAVNFTGGAVRLPGGGPFHDSPLRTGLADHDGVRRRGLRERGPALLQRREGRRGAAHQDARHGAGPHAIRVNAVAPGWIRTPMTDRHDAADRHRAEATMARITPLGRVGEPEDVAHTVLHLASDASAFMTGQILRPNGGVAMPW